VFGTEFCTGFVDHHGNWNNGFPCPSSNISTKGFCCGDSIHRYCCTGTIGDQNILLHVTSDGGGEMDQDISKDYHDFFTTTSTMIPPSIIGTTEDHAGGDHEVRNEVDISRYQNTYTNNFMKIRN
jgi:hypothetical protein